MRRMAQKSPLRAADEAPASVRIRTKKPGKQKDRPKGGRFVCGEWGIRTPEGFHPTRFPSARHRPLGEFSLESTIEIAGNLIRV